MARSRERLVMRTPSSIVAHDAERDTYLVLDDFGGRLGCAWRETNAESADPQSAGRVNDDGVPMSDSTLHKALRIMGYDTGPGSDHCAHSFRSTVSTLLNEEGAFDGDVVEAQLAYDTEEKSAGGGTRWCGASLARATRTRSAASISVRPVG